MIGKVIVNLLTANAGLLVLVPETSIYPHVIDEDTPLPSIVYRPEPSASSYTKDGWVGDDMPFSVAVFSRDYADAQDIAAEIRSALELEEGTYEGITIRKIYLDRITEGSDGEVFGIVLTFKTVIIGF
jgi:hypothetical protein